MAKSKIIAIAVSVGLVLVAAVVAGVLWATNRLPIIDVPSDKTFNVGIGSEIYGGAATGFVLDNGATVTVTTPAEDYDVTIVTKAASADFAFTVGGEEWQWSDTQGVDFTSGFTIVKDGKTFTVTYTNLATVIAKVLKYDYGEVHVPNVPAGDLFEMRIASDDKTITLGFTLSDLGGNVGLIGIEIDPGHIIFGGDNDQTE